MVFATRSGRTSSTPGSPFCGNPSVRTKPGFTAVTCTPPAATSACSASENATTACFVAEYTATPGIATLPAIDPTFTTWPRRAASMDGRKTFVTDRTPIRFVRTISSIRSGEACANGPPPGTPR